MANDISGAWQLAFMPTVLANRHRFKNFLSCFLIKFHTFVLMPSYFHTHAFILSCFMSSCSRFHASCSCLRTHTLSLCPHAFMFMSSCSCHHVCSQAGLPSDGLRRSTPTLTRFHTCVTQPVTPHTHTDSLPHPPAAKPTPAKSHPIKKFPRLLFRRPRPSITIDFLIQR